MKILAPLLLSLFVAGHSCAQEGRWRTESGNLEVEIAPCGEALCGTVVRVLANHSMSDASAEMVPADARSPLGMKILSDVRRSGENQWTGEIYNRENAKTYRCRLTLTAPDQLAVRGYVWLPLFGKTQVWRRVADAPRGEDGRP